MKKDFNRHPPALSEGFNVVIEWFVRDWGHLVDGTRGDMNRWAPRLAEWSDAIDTKCGPFDEEHFGSICLYIDGTFKSCCRPGPHSFFNDLQRVFYSGYHKNHGLCFQGISAPNGLIIDLWGPSPGRENDLYLFRESNMKNRLDVLFNRANVLQTAAGRTPKRFRCYGDSIYIPSTSISRRRRMPPLSAGHVAQNFRVNKGRTSIEWTFGKIVSLFKFVDFKKNLKLGHSKVGVANYYTAAAFLTNFHTCLEGSQTGLEFGCAPPTLSVYMAGGTAPQNAPIV